MEILGIGNALLDIFSFSDDETALSLGLHPNHSVHVSADRLDELLLAVPAPIFVAGGSATNALKTASALGAECAFAGCTGMEVREKDQWAQIFAEDLSSFGVKSLLENRNKPTGRCLVIHMPGGMKSVACAPSAANEFTHEQMRDILAEETQAVFLDGQILRNVEICSYIAETCRERAIPLALDIASTGIVQSFSGGILKILQGNKTILFMNSDEALALASALEHTVPGERGIQTEEAFVNSVFSFHASGERPFPCIIEKRGENGSRAWQGGRCYEAKTIPVEFPLDDTGAGDTFDGAFLVSYLGNVPIAESLAFANEVALEALKVPGSRYDRDQFSALKEKLSALRSNVPSI